MRPAAFGLSCLLLSFPLSVCADPGSPSSLRSDILYTHRGEFVQVSPMRPLTLNAHVGQFAYDPLGIEIAVVGSEPQGENTLHFVKTVDVRTGREISRFTTPALAGSPNNGLMLRGWSLSGRYLLLQRFFPDPQEPQTALSEFLRWDLSASPPATLIIHPQEALPIEQRSSDLEGSADCYPSPDNRWLLFTQSVHTYSIDGKPRPDRNVYLLYDPEHQTFKLLTLPPSVSFYSWSDSTHLKFRQGTQREQFDVVTSQISSVTTPFDFVAPAVSKQYPDLSLSYEQQDLEDKQVKGSGGHVPACIVWIHRSPYGKTPFGAAAAGLMPYGNVSSSDITNPEAVWSPTGKQVAFLANDDLCVTDLMTVTGPLPSEKLAVGLTLTCADEQILAMSQLKMIGLGLIQYIQDNDEHYPTADGFEGKIYPYIKLSGVFDVAGHHFVYEQPTELSLAKMDSPATTENGYIDLPCARVVLMADGHVKVLPKQEAAP